MAAVRPKPIEHPRWKEPSSYGVLHNHYFNHYLKHDSAPAQITDQSSPAERDAALAIRALPTATVGRIRRAIKNNFQEKLTERGIAYKNTIIHAIKENCEPDCARRARQKAIDAFGRDRVENAHRLSRKGQTVLQDFIDDKKRAFIVASKIPGAVKWNTYMTEGVRVAEQILMELLVEYEGYRRQEVVQKVRQMRKAAEDERVKEVMDEIRNRAATAAKRLFGFIQACQEMEKFDFVYTQHPSERTDYPDEDGTFWCRLSDDKWSETKRRWFEGIDDAKKPSWWEHTWYTAKELEEWCETYKTYAETHDPAWEKLRETFGGKPAHQNWIDLSQEDDDEKMKFDEWQGYTVAGLKFFLVDLLDHYRRTAEGVCEEGAEDALRVEVVKQNVENRRVARVAARAELDKEQRSNAFIDEVNRKKTQVDDLHKSIRQLSRQSKQRTEKFKQWTELLDQFVKAWNEFTELLKDELLKKETIWDQTELKDDAKFWKGEIESLKVFEPFAEAGYWLERTIELWQKKSEDEWGQIKYTLETVENEGEYEMQLVADDEELLDNIRLENPAFLENMISEQERQHDVAVADQKRKRQTGQSLRAAEKRLQEQQRKRREEAEKKKQDENRARAAQMERRAAAIEKQRQELAQRSVEMERQDEQERLEEEDELARQASLLNRGEKQKAKELNTAKKVLKEISEMKPSKISVDELTALPHLVKSLDEKLPLQRQSVDDDTVKYISKCRKRVRKVKNITIKESATNVLRKVKQSLETLWLPKLEVEYFESKLLQLNKPEIPKRRKRRRKPNKEEEKAPWQKSKETKMWEKDIWPLIQEDMITSFEKTNWDETVKANKQKSEAELRTPFLENLKEEYAKDNEGTWWVLKNEGRVIATTQVDTSQTKPPGPELYVLKVRKDYESLGVGRYFSFLIQKALFHRDLTNYGAQEALRNTMKKIDWDNTEGIVLTPSTVNEKGVYESWRDTRAAYEDKVEKAVRMKNANVRKPKHDGEESAADSPGASSSELYEEEESFATPVVRAPVLFKPGHPVHAMHATFAKAVRAHFSAMSKMFSKNAVPRRRRYRLGPMKVYPMQSKSLMVPTPTAIKLRTKTAPPVAMPSLMSASKGAPPSPPRGMFRG